MSARERWLSTNNTPTSKINKRTNTKMAAMVTREDDAKTYSLTGLTTSATRQARLKKYIKSSGILALYKKYPKVSTATTATTTKVRRVVWGISFISLARKYLAP